MQRVRAWCVYDPKGRVVKDTLHQTRDAAIAEAEVHAWPSLRLLNWKRDLYAKGYRCRRGWFTPEGEG